jgi:hypothetical protein
VCVRLLVHMHLDVIMTWVVPDSPYHAELAYAQKT